MGKKKRKSEHPKTVGCNVTFTKRWSHTFHPNNTSALESVEIFYISFHNKSHK
jgi:hypothetical protein